MGLAEARGEVYIELARALDRPAQFRPAPRPAPRPPRALRPDRLSVTRIETLRRDPYAIFAESILRLSPLEPIGVAMGPREIGNVWHAALQEFSEDFRFGARAPRRARAAPRHRARAFRADARRSLVPRHALAAHRPRLRQVLELRRGAARRRRAHLRRARRPAGNSPRRRIDLHAHRARRSHRAFARRRGGADRLQERLAAGNRRGPGRFRAATDPRSGDAVARRLRRAAKASKPFRRSTSSSAAPRAARRANSSSRTRPSPRSSSGTSPV